MADTNTEVIDFPSTATREANAETVAVALDHTDDIKGDHQRQPIVPEQGQRHNIRSTVSYLAGLHWHRARFHGLRSPAYLARCVFYALRGGARLPQAASPDGLIGPTAGSWKAWQSPLATSTPSGRVEVDKKQVASGSRSSASLPPSSWRASSP